MNRLARAWLIRPARRLIALPLLFVSAGMASAGAPDLKGRVLDPQGAVVPGAILSLFAQSGSLEASTSSDTTGCYQFSKLPPGDYLLQAQAKGFAVYRAQRVHVSEASSRQLDVTFALASTAQQVVVTAANMPQLSGEVAKAVTTINQDSVELRDVYALGDAVRPTPGLYVQQLGGPGAFLSFRIRGLRDQDTAVLVDGLRLRDASGTQGDASGLLEDVLASDVSRIEVLRGSGSSLYGTDAIGGAINVITDQGGGSPRRSVLVEGGSLGLFRGKAQFAGGGWTDRIQYSAALSHLNVTEGVDGDDAARIWSGQGWLQFRLAPFAQLSVRALGATSFLKLNNSAEALVGGGGTVVPARPLPDGALHAFEHGLRLTEPFPGGATYIQSANDPDSSRAGNFFTGAILLSGRIAAPLAYTASYQAVTDQRVYGNGPAGVGFQPAGNTTDVFSGRIQTATGQVSYQPESHQLLTGGYEWESERLETGATEQFAPASKANVSVTQDSNAAFAQDQLRLWNQRLYLAGSFRAQTFSLNRPRFFPGASAPYQLPHFPSPSAAYTGDGAVAYFHRTTSTKIRAHIGRGYRAPSLFERFGTGFDSLFGYSVYGDPRLEPERSIAVDAGVDQAFAHDRAHVSATYFYTHLQRVIVFDVSGAIDVASDPFGRFIGYRNTSGGLARGVELSGDWAPVRQLRLMGNYTFTDARERAPTIPGVYRTFISPEHQYFLMATQQLGPRFTTYFTLSATSNYLAPLFGNAGSSAFRFPGLKRATIGASYRMPLSEGQTLRWFVKADNLANQRYFESGFRTPGATANGGFAYEF